MNENLLLGFGLWCVFWATPPGWLVIGALVEPELAMRRGRTFALWCALTLAASFLQVLLDGWTYACRDSPLAMMYSGCDGDGLVSAGVALVFSRFILLFLLQPVATKK